MNLPILASGATFDRSQQYRYNLWRRWSDQNDLAVFVMLNPSRGDQTYNDQTIRSCISFAQLLGYSSLEVVNLFAYRTPDPRELKAARNPVGKRNDEFIVQASERADVVILGWGNHGSLLNRDIEVLTLLRETAKGKMHCLGATKQGQPRHPLYLKHTAPLLPV